MGQEKVHIPLGIRKLGQMHNSTYIIYIPKEIGDALKAKGITKVEVELIVDATTQELFKGAEQ